jgi:hypothetical protein
LLTITTRSLNEGALWQFGDSSLGKNWGTGPTQLESATLGINFFTAADSLFLVPLDSSANPLGRTIPAVRSNGSWRVAIDLAAEMTPWFGVRQIFGSTSSAGAISEAFVGDVTPLPASDRAFVTLDASISADARAIVVDAFGRAVMNLNAAAGATRMWIDLSRLASGTYTLLVETDGRTIARRLVVAR